ncbi:hypothetical protein KCG44_09335 [Pacificimonas sp. WHA3]|uniref:Capsule biosynthesis protein n=1 Tax=Pacificimonas pallii TaxID=2827236 RepID=A0ABS6SF13_9SPHN|nr:DUF6356 family protein [Pacificimonas pallii]MBV7256984.1 hypothetical protein [Pacificimonas pallii]
MQRLFTQHPKEVGESYGEHMMAAFSFGGTMFLTSIACLLHGIFPFLFTRTGSRCVTNLHDRMVVNRSRVTNTQNISAE